MQNPSTPDTQVSEPEIVDATIIYQQDKAQIDTQIATAKQFPRNITKAIDDCKAIVTLDNEIASSCTYSLPRGGKQITGPSVHLAKIIAQNWGNMRIEAKVVDIGFKQITSQAVAFDLEKNLAIKVEVKRNIVDKYGKKFKDDMITVTGNAANAIALRNAVFAVVPKGVVENVWKASQRKVLGDLSDEDKMNASRKNALKEFKDNYGVSEEEVLELLGKPSVSTIDRDDLMTLFGVKQSLIDGDTTVNEVFNRSTSKKDKDGKTKEQKTVDAVKKGMSKVKASKDSK